MNVSVQFLWLVVGFAVVFNNCLQLSAGQETENKTVNIDPRIPEPLTFVQISDIHMDSAYTEGAPTSCLQTVCCHSTIGLGGSAGKFGDYNCDAAEPTVTAMLDFIKTLDPAPQFFVYVGDSSPHAVFERLVDKIQDNLLVNTLLVDKLRDIGPIYPALGNHELFPQSVYRRRSLNAQLMLQFLSMQWPFMFDVDLLQRGTIRQHAYYTALIQPGLRVLTTNSMYEYLYNIFAANSDSDPVKKEQQDFVRQTLTDARTNNEKVIFVSHMKPSAANTYPSYTDEMNQLLTDFGDVIVLQLFGHEHIDSFLLNRNPSDLSQTTGVSLAAPAATTYYSLRAGINPSFRVFKLDPVTFKPLDYDQYYIDIREANANGVAEVKKQYTFTEEYDLPDLTPASYQILSDRIHTDWNYFQKFEANYDVLSGNADKCRQFNRRCRRQLTCQTRESTRARVNACIRRG